MAGKKKAATKRKPSAAFMKPMQPSDALAEIVGDKPLPRTEITKRVWVASKGAQAFVAFAKEMAERLG